MEKEFTEGDAFVAAYSEYFGVVYKEALKYSGNHHIAEDRVVALLKEQCFHELGIDIFRELYQKNARWYKAVTLVYYADMPQKEVAKRMGITLNALEGILKRARKWMIKRYKDQYDRLHDI